MRTAHELRSAADDPLTRAMALLVLSWPIEDALALSAEASANLLKLPDSEDKERALWFILWAMGNDNIRWMRI